MYPTVIFMTKEKPIPKKESFNRITLCQIVVITLLLFIIFFFKNDGVKRDYSILMSKSYTKDDFTAIASSLQNYLLNESALKAVFSEGKTETDEALSEKEKGEEKVKEEKKEDKEETKSVTEAENASGGEDISKNEAPSSCSFDSPELQREMKKPLENFRYTSFFGERVNPITKKTGFHTGVDMAAKEGSKIRAVLDGKVTKTGEDERAGKYIQLTHKNGLTTLYCHCSEILAEKGAVIRKGETIALVGSTGMSTGPHLHFEVAEKDIRKDPYPLLENAS